MNEATINQIMDELGMGDANRMDQIVLDAVQGTVYQNLAELPNSPFYTLFNDLFRKPDQEWLTAVRSLIPQFFISSADIDAWVEEHAASHELSRDPGTIARAKMRVMKSSDIVLELDTDYVFYVDEHTPRRYSPIQDYEFPQGTDECLFVVAAPEIGAHYNVLNDVITKCETALPVNSIANYDMDVNGADRETNENLKKRIFAKKFAGAAPYGTQLKYIAALLSVAAVKHAVQKSVDNDTATINFCIYGAGPLSQETVTEAENTLSDYLMDTDKAAIVTASPQALTVTVKTEAEIAETELRDKINDFFTETGVYKSFEASLLSDHLYDNLPIEGKAVRIVPAFQDPNEDSYFEITVEIDPWQ